MIEKEDEKNQAITQKPKSRLKTIFFVTALVIGAIGLVFCWYIAGVARGFSNS